MLVPKRTHMVDGIEKVIISLYAKGMSNSDIQEQICEVYGFDVSTSTISRITDKVTRDIVAWQNRPLESVYLITWMDGIVFKVRENSKVVNKTMYIAVGLGRDGKIVYTEPVEVRKQFEGKCFLFHALLYILQRSQSYSKSSVQALHNGD